MERIQEEWVDVRHQCQTRIEPGYLPYGYSDSMNRGSLYLFHSIWFVWWKGSNRFAHHPLFQKVQSHMV